ncbi:glycosyltransferase family 4 protein [Lutibacter holmesii]|uniref:Glycosyltransferase family 4 protein n=1 Tax=Lutibacter holmesii TaxID=1137985 RepID=A0ABW3WPR3_9FLAO
MKFIIITNAPTLNKENEYYSYAPYVNEINIWSKFIDELGIVSPIEYHKELLLSEFNSKINVYPIKEISFTTVYNVLKSIYYIPKICIQIYNAMQWADHIHLRCPGNIGLLGCFVQMLFPKKPKTVKYAGNWDPKSKQPWSYKLQKWILSKTFLTRNCKVLVYGEWPNQSKNIIPFFTASYAEKEMEEIDIVKKVESLRQAQIDSMEHHPELVEGTHDVEFNDKITRSFIPGNYNKEVNDEMLKRVQYGDSNCQLVQSRCDVSDQKDVLKFMYVGGLVPGKQPLLSVHVVHELHKKGYKVQLDMFGDGVERVKLSTYIVSNSLEDIVVLHGNKAKEVVKKAYQQAHFLVFISKSEGWPKVVAEAMFWGCLPVTTKVSCIPYMLDNGNRGAIVNANVDEIVWVIENYIKNSGKYKEQILNAIEWSWQFTLEKFEMEIGKLLRLFQT